MNHKHHGLFVIPAFLLTGSLSLIFSACAILTPPTPSAPPPSATQAEVREDPFAFVPLKDILLALDPASPEPVPEEARSLPAPETEDGASDEGPTETDYQEMIDQAIEFCEDSRSSWDAGNPDAAVEALDKAFALIRGVGADAPPDLVEQKDDLRFTISKRIVEIYGSRVTVVQGHHRAIPLAMNAHVNEAITFLTGRERGFFLDAYRLSGRYRPSIAAALKKAGLPEELSWLPLIESGFKTRALSQAGALGLWQFMPATGYKYGLKRTRWIDERMDPEKSTRAAIDYLKELHQIFGDWATALAAYNCGEGNVLKKIRSQRTSYLDNFWDLYQSLPHETAKYVPRFLAVLHILSDPAAYGLSLPEPDEPLQFRETPIAGRSSLRTLARHIGVDPQELAQLNPELRRGYTPDKAYALRVPMGTEEALLANLAEASADAHDVSEVVVHRVRPGDSLFDLARAYGTSIEAIIDMNDIKNGHFLKVGWDLRIPAGGAGRRSEGSIAFADEDGPDSETAYRVRKGDSLWKIAGRFKTSPKALRDFNQLPNADIREGQVLRIPAAVSLYIRTKDKDRNV